MDEQQTDWQPGRRYQNLIPIAGGGIKIFNKYLITEISNVPSNPIKVKYSNAPNEPCSCSRQLWQCDNAVFPIWQKFPMVLSLRPSTHASILYFSNCILLTETNFYCIHLKNDPLCSWKKIQFSFSLLLLYSLSFSQ